MGARACNKQPAHPVAHMQHAARALEARRTSACPIGASPAACRLTGGDDQSLVATQLHVAWGPSAEGSCPACGSGQCGGAAGAGGLCASSSGSSGGGPAVAVCVVRQVHVANAHASALRAVRLLPLPALWHQRSGSMQSQGQGQQQSHCFVLVSTGLDQRVCAWRLELPVQDGQHAATTITATVTAVPPAVAAQPCTAAAPARGMCLVRVASRITEVLEPCALDAHCCTVRQATAGVLVQAVVAVAGRGTQALELELELACQ